MSEAAAYFNSWKVRSPVGKFILSSQAVSLPLALAFGELQDVIIAVLLPFYGIMVAGFAAIYAITG